MKIGKHLLLLYWLVLIFPVFVFAFEQSPDMGINNEQPISIGEIIYRSQKIEYIANGKVVNAIVYTYDGCDVNSIKIKIGEITISAAVRYMNEKPAEIKSVPLNSKKQALLKVKTLNEAQPYKEILITVIDEFYRIRVEEFKK
ncbi:MAG: hypothetical protein AB1798_11845 [Spirochaetota bacterium]